MADISGARSEADEVRRYTFIQRLSLVLVSWVVPAIIALIGSTLRYRYSVEERGPSTYEELYPGIFPFWHRCVLPATWFFRQRDMAVITSQSLDGEYIARVIKRLGYVPIRGSSSRGGQRALMETQSFVKHGGAAAFTIDGPRGPRFLAKRGPIYLARGTGAPITPFYVAVEKKWVLNSWDRFVIPKPFSRALIRAGAPIHVPHDADEATLDDRYQQMQAALERVTAFAEDNFASAWDAARAVDRHGNPR